MLQRVEAQVGEVRGLRVPEDPEHSALVLELVEHAAPVLVEATIPIVRPYATVRSNRDAIAPSQIRSAASTASSITRRPPTDSRTRPPPTRPMSAAGTPSLAARSSASRSRPAATDTTARDADSPNSVT